MKKFSLKQKILSSCVVVLLAVAMTFTIAPQKTEAIFGIGDIVIDIKALLEAVAKHIAVTSLKNANDKFTGQFVNTAISKLGVQNYLGYARAVADKVYVSYELANETDVERQYLLRVSAQEQSGVVTTTKSPSLVNIYNQRALTQFNYAALQGSLASAAANNSLFVDWSGYNTVLATPQGQQYDTMYRTGEIVAASAAAAQNNISSGNGYKDLFTCQNAVAQANTAGNNANANNADALDAQAKAELQAGAITQDQYQQQLQDDDNGFFDQNSTLNTTQTIGAANCAVKNPAAYVTTQIDSKIDALFDQQLVPNDVSSAIGAFIGDTLAKQLSNKLLNGGTSNGSLIQDLTH